jgi:uncharacterized surface protein with fasciclin (FAS1) repeats
MPTTMFRTASSTSSTVSWLSWVTHSIADRVSDDGDLSTLYALVVYAGLGDLLSDPGELTFAPTNAAPWLSADDADHWSPAGKDTLISILSYHVFPDHRLERADRDPRSGLCRSASMSVCDPIMFNNARAVAVDILANNGCHPQDQHGA